MSEQSSQESWDLLRDHLVALEGHIRASEPGPKRLYGFADGFLKMVRAYQAVVIAEGKTSIRVQAVVKALELKTPKSAILNFLTPEALNED